MPTPRIVFMGTGDIAIPSFLTLIGNGLDALVTQPDKPVGRKQVLTKPQIKKIAEDNGIPVLQPERARNKDFLNEVRELQPDIIVVMAYGQILTQEILDIPSVAFINLHASLLPKYRGAACIQATIDAGDSHTGVTAMHVVKALDAGDIILKKETPIGESETGGELHDRLAELAPQAMNEAIQLLMLGNAPRVPQDENLVSYIPKLMREHGEIDWSMPADQLERRIRAYDPWPGTSTTYQEASGRNKGRVRRLKIFPQTKVVAQSGESGEVLKADEELIIACGENALKIEHLQPDGSRRMSADDFLRSSPISKGDVLGVTC
ncbi:MAG: methionyl-tRNA formyltransferase [Akkermansiaceae bacterium]